MQNGFTTNTKEENMGKAYTTEELLKFVEDIVVLCDESISQADSPNIKEIKIIRNDFDVIQKSLLHDGKIVVLNPQKDLNAARIIIDSALLDYDSDLFDKVFQFEKICRTLPLKQLKFQYSY